MIKATKLIATWALIITCIIFITGCNKGEKLEEEIDFVVGEARVTTIDKPITVIIDSLSDNTDDRIIIDEKYDSSFFKEKSLIVIAFRTRTTGETIDEVNVVRKGNNLTVNIIGTNGLFDALSQVTIMLEVNKNDIKGVKNISFTTDINKL
jgi:light-regulated signal transduction histidine kinase (bacteriophytochrome)